ncbi:hypothetical protein [Saccharolobus islandicus]|nr:hypothetical protein [Sulfolobus islandicus]
MAMGKLTYLAIIISIIVIASLVWVNFFPSIFPPSIKEMRNTFTASVTTPRVNACGVNSTSFNLCFSIKVTIPDYSGRVLLATGVIPLGANPCTYLPSSFSPNITPPVVYSGFSSKTFVVMLLNSTVYTENKTFIVSLDAVSTPNDNWVFLSQGFNLKETPVVWIMVFEDHHVYRIGVIEFERVGEGLLYMPKIERC